MSSEINTIDLVILPDPEYLTLICMFLTRIWVGRGQENGSQIRSALCVPSTPHGSIIRTDKWSRATSIHLADCAVVQSCLKFYHAGSMRVAVNPDVSP
jgi:hypothetical protein